MRWGRFLTKPPRNLVHVGKLARLVASRPAFVRAMEQEKLGEPFFG